MPASWQACLPVSMASAVSATIGVRSRPNSRLAASQVTCRFDAVHSRHVDIREDGIERFMLNKLKCRFASTDFTHGVAAPLQQLADQHGVDGIVLGDENAFGEERRRLRAGLRRNGVQLHNRGRLGVIG